MPGKNKRELLRAAWDFFVLFSGISTASNLSRTQGRQIYSKGLFLFRPPEEKKPPEPPRPPSDPLLPLDHPPSRPEEIVVRQTVPAEDGQSLPLNVDPLKDVPGADLPAVLAPVVLHFIWQTSDFHKPRSAARQAPIPVNLPSVDCPHTLLCSSPQREETQVESKV